MLRDTTAVTHLALLADLESHMGKALGPYEEFTLDGKTYYVSPGGFLYRKDPAGGEEVGGYFCGYLDDEVWECLKHYLKVA